MASGPGEVQAAGEWGAVTATINWCEADYTVTDWVAEFWNAATNIVFISLAAHGIVRAHQQRLPKEFTFAFGTTALVGIGSLLFHSTLKSQFQVLDEVPMVIVVATLLWILVDYKCLALDSPPSRARRGMAIVVAFLVVHLAIYFTFRKVAWYHQAVFATAIISATARGFHLVFWVMRKRMSKTRLRSHWITAVKMFTTGVGVFLLGFLLWHLDQKFCTTLRRWRERLGPASFLLELHAWWHIGTGVGAYILITGAAYMCLSLARDPDDYKMKYTLHVLPYVVTLQHNEEHDRLHDVVEVGSDVEQGSRVRA